MSTLVRGATVLLLGCACPSAVSDSPPRKSEASEVERLESDPRVVKSGNSFYAKDALRDPAGSDEETRAPGSGMPDESNGRCRLYAPELPEPECCRGEYGFDAERVREACKLGVYLGESFHMSCGYFFHRDDDTPTWFRMSFVPGRKPHDALASHDRNVRRMAKDPEFRSKPIPGIKGAYWGSQGGLNWAFLPGWSKVRQFTWPDEACDREDVLKVFAELVQAKEPKAGSRRTSLIPQARNL